MQIPMFTTVSTFHPTGHRAAAIRSLSSMRATVPIKMRSEILAAGRWRTVNSAMESVGAKDFIWLCLPYVSEDRSRNQLQWWGNVEATVEYCKEAVSQVCHEYGGNRDELILAGFSRGSIACNYIGLHDDQIASLWMAFVCHSHYDGVRRWNYPGSDRESAATRLRRLQGRPQFISHERSTEETEAYLAEACPMGTSSFSRSAFATTRTNGSCVTFLHDGPSATGSQRFDRTLHPIWRRTDAMQP